MPSWILFFDGDCAFCSRSVRRIVALDKKARIAFSLLQGELAEKYGFRHYAAENGGSMVLLRETDSRVFTHSDSWIELACALGGWWKILTITRWIPRAIRDRVYCFVAANRYRIFGKSDTCGLPDPELLKRLRP